MLFFARYEASQLGGLAMDTEHILLGLIREANGLTRRVFTRAGISLGNLREEIAGRGVVQERLPTSAEMPFAAEVKRALQAAAEEADRLHHEAIGPEHLLLGLLRDEASVAGRILTDRGLRLDAVRLEISR